MNPPIQTVVRRAGVKKTCEEIENQLFIESTNSDSKFTILGEKQFKMKCLKFKIVPLLRFGRLKWSVTSRSTSESPQGIGSASPSIRVPTQKWSVGLYLHCVSVVCTSSSTLCKIKILVKTLKSKHFDNPFDKF